MLSILLLVPLLLAMPHSGAQVMAAADFAAGDSVLPGGWEVAADPATEAGGGSQTPADPAADPNSGSGVALDTSVPSVPSESSSSYAVSGAPSGNQTEDPSDDSSLPLKEGTEKKKARVRGGTAPNGAIEMGELLAFIPAEIIKKGEMANPEPQMRRVARNVPMAVTASCCSPARSPAAARPPSS